MKLASIFFKASAGYIRAKRKLQQTSEKYEACFNIFQSDNAKIALFATTGALALQRSAACRHSKYSREAQIQQVATTFRTKFGRYN